jgi:hypothetical protein
MFPLLGAPGPGHIERDILDHIFLTTDSFVPPHLHQDVPRGKAMEATSQGWSRRGNVIGCVLKFGLLIQRVRIPSDQSVDPQVGSEPCSDG